MRQLQVAGLLTANILFLGRVGYLRRSSVFGVLAGKIGGGDEVLEPLPLHEIIDVRAGVVMGATSAATKKAATQTPSTFVKQKVKKASERK